SVLRPLRGIGRGKGQDPTDHQQDCDDAQRQAPHHSPPTWYLATTMRRSKKAAGCPERPAVHQRATGDKKGGQVASGMTPGRDGTTAPRPTPSVSRPRRRRYAVAPSIAGRRRRAGAHSNAPSHSEGAPPQDYP